MTARLSIPTEYSGVLFRSKLEADWACQFDAMGIAWEFEPRGIRVGKTFYLPDFWLPRSRQWVEVKGAGYTPPRGAQHRGHLRQILQAFGGLRLAHLEREIVRLFGDRRASAGASTFERVGQVMQRFEIVPEDVCWFLCDRCNGWSVVAPSNRTCCCCGVSTGSDEDVTMVDSPFLNFPHDPEGCVVRSPLFSDAAAD